MFKKVIFGIMMTFCGCFINCSQLDYFKAFFYAAHNAGSTYYQLAKKSGLSKDCDLLKEGHIYTNTLLVHLLFPIYFLNNSPKPIISLSEHELLQYARSCGNAAHNSFILPVLGALILTCCTYYSIKKIIKLIKS